MNVRLSQLYPRQATSDVISNENPLFDTSKFDQAHLSIWLLCSYYT